MRTEVFRWQPFLSRRHQGSVIGVRFPHRDPVVVQAMKEALLHYMPRAMNPERKVYNGGGWLPEHRAWFVEPVIWPMVATALHAAGCEFIHAACPDEIAQTLREAEVAYQE